MENQIKEYIRQLFAELPQNTFSPETLADQEAKTLRQAMDRYHDLIMEGKKPEIAYEIVLSHIGKTEDILQELEQAEALHRKLNEQKFTTEQLNHAAKRSGILQALAVFLYINCTIPPLLLSSTAFITTLAPGLLLAMIAIATALLVYNANTRLPHPTTQGQSAEEQAKVRRKSALLKSIGVFLIILAAVPAVLFSYNEIGAAAIPVLVGLGVGCLIYDKNTRPRDCTGEQACAAYEKWEEKQSRERIIIRTVNCVIWLATVALYILLSVATQAWYATWLIFLLAAAITNIIKAVVRKRGKTTIILWSAAAVISALLLIASLAAVMLGFYLNSGSFGLNMSNVSYENANQYQVGNAELHDNINSLEINWTAGNVTVQAYDGDTVSISESQTANDDTKLRYHAAGGNLIIQYCRSNIGFGKDAAQSKDLTVKLPRAMANNLRELEISSTSAVVNLENLTVNELDMENVSGTLNCRNVITHETGIDTVSGDCEYQGHCSDLSFDSTSGSLTYTETGADCPQEFDASTISGNAQLILPASCPGFVATLSSLSSDFETDFFVSADREGYRYGNGGREYEFDTVSGHFSIMQAK